jgi:hypothetical protein
VALISTKTNLLVHSLRFLYRKWVEFGLIKIQKYMCTFGLSAFRDRGSLSRRVSVPRAPAQMGRARGRARRGERSEEGGVRREREMGIPRPSCSSRAQVGCACSRGLQASTWVREASGPERAPVSSSSPRGQPSLRRPWSFLL